jgi:flagellar biosynthesis protein FlhB
MSQYNDSGYGAALRYSEEDDLPAVVAAVKGQLVEKLREIADMYGIPVYKDPFLARALAEEGAVSVIPEKFFPAVAEVLAYCYRVDARFAVKVDRRLRKGSGANE